MSKLMKLVCCLAVLALSSPSWADPVTNADQARKLADEWIKASGIAGVAVHDMTTSSLLFIAGLHEVNDQQVHVNQLLIRKDDGFAALVVPAHDNPAASPSQRLGMEGLSGMSGMSGTRRSQQQMGKGSRPTPVRSAAEAKRRLESWLAMNNLSLLQAGKVTPVEGIYIAELHDPDKKVVNEAVLRRVDGYITLVRPVKLPDMTFPSVANQK
jgi:hypothetical protein